MISNPKLSEISHGRCDLMRYIEVSHNVCIRQRLSKGQGCVMKNNFDVGFSQSAFVCKSNCHLNMLSVAGTMSKKACKMIDCKR